MKYTPLFPFLVWVIFALLAFLLGFKLTGWVILGSAGGFLGGSILQSAAEHWDD